MAKAKGSGVMGHEKTPSKCNGFSAQKKDIGKVQVRSKETRGTPDKAFGYKY